MLQEIRMGNISLNTWNLLYQKAATPNEQPLNAILNTTNIVGYKKTANKSNNMICNMLPVNENKFLINTAIDYINNEQHNPNESEKLFKGKTNYPNYLRLQQGICVMYLKNDLTEHKIYNGNGVAAICSNLSYS